MPSRSKRWSRDELILALDLYFRLPHERFDADAPEVMDLAEYLRKFPLEPGEKRPFNYRSDNSVVMKLWNFARIDPDFYGGVLEHGSKLEEEIWYEFALDRRRLSQLAARIKESLDALETSGTELPEISDDVMEAPEGRLLTRMHLARERNRKLVAKKKQRALAEHGALTCEACGFDFHRTYGDRGSSFIECHHDTPVHALRPGHRTRLEELSLLCSNCHRMIHARRPWLSVNELQALLERERR